MLMLWLAFALLCPWIFWLRPVYVVDLVLLLVLFFLSLLCLDLVVGAKNNRAVQDSFQAHSGRLYLLVASISVSLFMGLNCFLDASESQSVTRSVVNTAAAYDVVPLVEIQSVGRSLFPLANSATVDVILGWNGAFSESVNAAPEQVILRYKPGFLGLPFLTHATN
mgnify:CR=1 FL=1